MTTPGKPMYQEITDHAERYDSTVNVGMDYGNGEESLDIVEFQKIISFRRRKIRLALVLPFLVPATLGIYVGLLFW